MSIGNMKVSAWSVLGRFTHMFVSFLSGVFTARMLIPKDYGAVSPILVFVQIASVFIYSSFTSTLIQKKDSDNKDFGTIFYFNSFFSVFFCLLLFWGFGAESITKFYQNEQLIVVTKILGFNLIIGAIAGSPKILLTIRLDFQILSLVSILSVLFGVGIGIYLACAGYGIYALLFQTLALIVYLVFVCWSARCSLLITLSLSSLKQLGRFERNLLFSNFISTVYANLNELVIGRVYSTSDVGAYSRGKSISVLPSLHISAIIDQVSYPILCKLQDSPQKLIQSYFSYLRYNTWLQPLCLLCWLLLFAF